MERIAFYRQNWGICLCLKLELKNLIEQIEYYYKWISAGVYLVNNGTGMIIKKCYIPAKAGI